MEAVVQRFERSVRLAHEGVSLMRVLKRDEFCVAFLAVFVYLL
jgi:hypothetical protein